MIRVQPQAFDVGAEYAALKSARLDAGAYALFVGSVRDMSGGRAVSAMTLEHYPGMTEQLLGDIEKEAHARWRLLDSVIIHRYGALMPGDDIVLVITASEHRQDAFDSCQFLMDWLKTKAPFWKLEEGDEGATWVDAKESDTSAAQRWTR